MAEQRLHLLRRREPLLEDETWHLLGEKVDGAQRLGDDRLRPQIDLVYACGAYFAWARKGAPWSRFLRLSKSANSKAAEHRAAIDIGGGYLSRFVMERTELLRHVDCSVAVPTSFGHYAERGFSVPDDLARSIESHLALPFLASGLASSGSEVELRGLNWAERRVAIRNTILAAAYDARRWPKVLVVDDVVTSGATMREAGRVLRAAGASAVFGVALAHTEG